MTRRAFLLAAIAAVLPAPVAADERGARKRDRHNRQCAAWARTRLRRGLTARERATLERRGCREDAVLGWVSGYVYPADE